MNIYESITGIMQEGYAVTKEKRNQQQGFMYRGIDDVMNTFQPLMSKYKIFCVPEVMSRERETRKTKNNSELIYSILTIKYTFYAEDGTSVSAVVIGEGMDSGDKASNKAMAVGMKYAMFQVFCIPTEEMKDPDAEMPPLSHRETIEDVQRRFEEPTKQLCEDCGKVIVSYKGANGKPVDVDKHIKASRDRYGKSLCIDCVMKRRAEESNADAAS